MRPLAPALQSSIGRSSAWAGAALVNAFAEKADGDRRADFAVMAAPGLTQWATIGTGPIRGTQVVADVLYAVSGTGLYSIDGTGTGILLGTIPGSGPVRMAGNYTQLAIAANGTGYVYSDTLQTPVPFDVSDVFYADGYIVWVIRDSEQFIISALDDALTYDASDIGSAEGSPDDIVGAVNSHREEVFFGSQSAEVFYNSGAADFPFERQGNAFVERGCFDRDSIVKLDNSVIFVGDDRIVYTLSGYQPQRISTHAIEYQLRDATYARAFAYAQEGHIFYALEVDTGTFVYDRATGAWHQRRSWGSTWWRCGGAVIAYGRTLLTDRATGALYTPSLDVHDEAGDPLSVEITLPTIEAGRERVTCYGFEMVCETGVGNASAPAPQAMLTYSDDGGHRWSNEVWRPLGAVGEYRTRAIWRKLGQFRQRQFRVTITDAVRRMVISYSVDTE